MTDAEAATREARLAAFIEGCLKGKVISMERQARWRPAWFVEVDTSDGGRSIYVRGKRDQAELLFFPLAHEAEVFRVLHEAGIPSPRIYGRCEEPEAIIMDRMPGRPDLSTADSEAEAAIVLKDMIGVMARMHALPPARFLNAPGLEIPPDARGLAFWLFDRFQEIQQANKRRPAPEVAFAVKWLKRNPPLHRTRPHFITCDSGQFLFDKGKVTSVLDMELAHIGDPALDLASLLLRDLSEPLGDLAPAFLHYEELTGVPIDWGVVKFYVALWGIMTPLVTLHLSQDPPPQLDLPYNNDQSTMLTRLPLEMIAEMIGAPLDPMPKPFERTGAGGSVAMQAALISLRGALDDVKPADGFERFRRDSAIEVGDYLGILIEHEHGVLAAERAETAQLLGRDIAGEDERNAALEELVALAGSCAGAALSPARRATRGAARAEAEALHAPIDPAA